MESFLIYIGKSAIAAGAFYIVFLLLFQNQKQFVFNRFYLPVSLSLSFVIPLITFTTVQYIEPTPAPDYNSLAYLADSTEFQSSAFEWDWYHYLFGIYLLGVAGFLFHLLLGHLKAISIIRKSRIQKLFECLVNITKKDVHPFSFFNKIVLSEKTLSHPNLDIIVSHENIHVKEKHTLDILFTELLFLVQWFNPFAWLIKDAVKNNLEYKTDHEIAKTNDPQTYQLAMVTLADKEGIAPFLTALNGSQLKNRIIMMKKKTQNKYALLKQLVVLPLLAVLVMGLSNKEVKTEIVQTGKKIDIVVDGKIIPRDNPALQSIDFSKGLDGREIMLALGIEDKVISNGINIENDEKTSVFFIRTSDYIPGTNPEFDKLTSEQQSEQNNSKSIKTIFAIDGKIISDEEAQKIESYNFESAAILSGGNAAAKYGEAAKDASVMDLKTGESRVKVSSNKTLKEGKVKGKVTDPNGDPIPGAAILIKGTTTGTITTPEGFYKLNLTDPNTTLVFTGNKFQKKEVKVNGRNEINVKLKYNKAGEVSTDNQSNNKNEYKYLLEGKVTDKKGEPISEAAVYVKGKTIGTITDNNGNYNLRVNNKNETLAYSMPGYKTKDVKVNGKNEINVELVADKNAKKESSDAIGYGKPGTSDIVNTHSKAASAFLLTDNTRDDMPMFIVDGVENKNISYLNPENIKSINVIKDKQATDLYGEKGKNGVVEITTKNYDNSVPKNFPGNPLVFVDGKEYDTIEDADVEPDEIESISVLKDKSATILYGEKGKNGVILVTTKGSKEIQKGDLPIVLNGRMTELTLNETDRDLLKTANKIEPEQAVKKYGERGKNGTIELKISKNFEDNHRSTGELGNENSVIRTPLELRKFIASNIKYPAKAQENDTEGKVSFNFRVDKNGNIFDISKPGPSGLALDEIIIIGYKSNKSGRYKKKVSTRILANEIKRVLELTPKLDIPEFNEKTINITVDFTLQYP